MGMTEQPGDGDFPFKPQESPVYPALAAHQVSGNAWETPAKRKLLGELRRWEEIFVAKFDLQIPKAALTVKRDRPNRLGYFRNGCNEFGLFYELAINERHLAKEEGWETLGTLLHELLHCWQYVHATPGRNNYHNVAYQRKAASVGLLVDSRGYTTYAEESPFKDLLREHGVHVPEITGPLLKVKGESKLKKWSCGCTNARVAVEFAARCLRCGNVFVRCD